MWPCFSLFWTCSKAVNTQTTWSFCKKVPLLHCSSYVLWKPGKLFPLGKDTLGYAGFHCIHKLEFFSEDIPRAVLWYNCWKKWPWGVRGITFCCMHMSCLVQGLCGVWCFVSGMGTLAHWVTHSVGVSLSGCVTQWVCHSVPKGRHLRGFCYPPHSH